MTPIEIYNATYNVFDYVWPFVGFIAFVLPAVLIAVYGASK